ncbi:hypothetical protein FRB96_006061 [Tulasnella sp. 330]|nr:hypothetical protein FRB96_006061 [Tulasnella sp. 330]
MSHPNNQEVHRITEAKPELGDRAAEFKPLGILIAIPDARPETTICTYALRVSNESIATLAWMEVTRRPKSDVDRGIEVLELVGAMGRVRKPRVTGIAEAHSSSAGHSDHYGTTEAYAGSTGGSERTVETRIFQYPIPGVPLRKTAGWTTFVSEAGDVLDEGKSNEDCMKFFVYLSQSIALELNRNVVNFPYHANGVVTMPNLLFQPHYTLDPQMHHVSGDQVRFVTWTASKRVVNSADPMIFHELEGDLKQRILEDAQHIRVNFLDEALHICRIASTSDPLRVALRTNENHGRESPT